jgi:argininosuccinate synthase
MENKKVVLAFSGGLDTSFCAKYLAEEKGLEVYTAIANTGGFRRELGRNRRTCIPAGFKKTRFDRCNPRILRKEH